MVSTKTPFAKALLPPSREGLTSGEVRRTCGEVRGQGNFRGSMGNFQGTTSGLFLKSTVREDLAKSPRNLLGSQGTKVSTAARGAGVQRFRGPLRASDFDPSFQQFGVSETPSQRPLRAPKRLSEAWKGCSETSERCVRSQRNGETRWVTQRPLRGPVFPDDPLEGSNPRAPTLGPQIKVLSRGSGDSPPATRRKLSPNFWPQRWSCLGGLIYALDYFLHLLLGGTSKTL